MVNEAITERLTRDILTELQYYRQDLKVEEQQSADIEINQLLSNASKSGTGNPGYPEFIIWKQNSDVIVIIECKASIKYHESDKRDKPKTYGVDGVLHYAKFLKSKYHVVAIAISGEKPTELKKSFFLWKKNEATFIQRTWDDLTTWDDYYSKFYIENTGITDIRSYAHKLHNDIRSKAKLKEAQKPLFIGGILLALDDEDFIKEYNTIQNPKKLAKRIVDAIGDKLKKSSIPEEKRQHVVDQFKFITNHTHLIKKQNTSSINHKCVSYLHMFLHDIHDNVYPIMQSANNVDLMGEFYIEFIRYTGGEGKGLGIVLTPPHITELFTDLVDISKNTKVLDICMGTGGFLVTTMSKMLNGDLTIKEIEQIRNGNLYGMESQTEIFALACVNMFIRGDGKANMFKGDSLDENDTQIKKLKGVCNIGFLNPPYSQKDQEELEFVKKMLDLLTVNGKGVVILPISCTNSNNNLRESILKSHTLEAVMIMPKELFTSSTHTCIMVFTAHKPHTGTSKTWFSVWDNDGLQKLKNRRIDRYGKWEDIKKEWLHDFEHKITNKKSLLKHVDHTSEWSALAYIETDYSELTPEKFVNTIRAHRLCVLRRRGKIISNDHIDHVKAVLNLPENEINVFKEDIIKNTNSRKIIDPSGWRKFKISDCFFVMGSSTTPIENLLNYEKNAELDARVYPYVTTRSKNNAVDGYYPYSTEIGGVLTVDSATIGYVSYRLQNFSASDHVEILRPKFDMDMYVGLFLQTILNLENFRYGYGRKFNQPRIRNTMIKLPHIDGRPDWKWMRAYMKEIDDLGWLCDY